MFDFWKRKKPEDPWDQQTENHIAQQDNTPHFQMYVDEVFFISGRGTVVTGTIKAGTLRVNDRILIMGKSGRLATQVGGLEAFHKIMEQAEAGEYVGVLLRDVKSTDVEKGDLLLKG